jgi:hypothetical protein
LKRVALWETQGKSTFLSVSFYSEEGRIMKTKFYCVNVEFHDDGRVLSCIISGERKEKPRNQYRRVYKMTAFKIWFVDENVASQLLAGIESGKFDVDGVLHFYSDFDGHDYQLKKAA